MLRLIPSRSGQNIFIWSEKNNSSRCWDQSLNEEVGRCFQVPRHLRASACINVWTVSLHTGCAFWDSPGIPLWWNRKHRQNWHPNITGFYLTTIVFDSRVASSQGDDGERQQERLVNEWKLKFLRSGISRNKVESEGVCRFSACLWGIWLGFWQIVRRIEGFEGRQKDHTACIFNKAAGSKAPGGSYCKDWNIKKMDLWFFF